MEPPSLFFCRISWLAQYFSSHVHTGAGRPVGRRDQDASDCRRGGANHAPPSCGHVWEAFNFADNVPGLNCVKAHPSFLLDIVHRTLSISSSSDRSASVPLANGQFGEINVFVPSVMATG
jgi:hypothetical protein